MKNFVTKSRQCGTGKKINILRYINQQIYYISSVSKSLLFETDDVAEASYIQCIISNYRQMQLLRKRSVWKRHQFFRQSDCESELLNTGGSVVSIYI